MRRAPALAAALLLVAPATGCSDPDVQTPAQPGLDGPLVFSGTDDGDAMEAIVAGEVTLDGTCLQVGGDPAVWPFGTRWDRATSTVVLPDGGRVGLGDRVSGGGGYVSPATAARGLGQVILRVLSDCAGPGGEVAFFDEGGEVTRGDEG